MMRRSPFTYTQAPEDCDLDDEAAWAAANPGIAAGIKSLAYMRDEARRVIATPADQADFRSYDLNLPGQPSREMICSAADWRGCLVDEADLPPRQGRVFVGFDLGGSSSMTCLAAIWENGRLECYGAFPDSPISLGKRGLADGCGNLYERAREAGELWTYSGRITPAGEFLKDCAERLRDCRVMVAGFDRYRKAEAIQALEQARERDGASRGEGRAQVGDGGRLA